MKDETKYIERLEAHDVKPTAMRILLLRTMMAHEDAFSLQSLEDELDTVDKSTIYRTITLFLTHHLIHAIDDGTGMFKYAVCSPDCHCGEDDGTIDHMHAHFYCEKCGKTFCLRQPRCHWSPCRATSRSIASTTSSRACAPSAVLVRG